MENFTPAMIEKAKTAKSAQELLDMARTGGLELTPEDADRYFEMLNPKTGELSDDELDAVTGGGCKSKKSGAVIVTNHCKCFTGMWESNIKGYEYFANGNRYLAVYRTDNIGLRNMWETDVGPHRCGSCRHLDFEGSIGVCGQSYP